MSLRRLPLAALALALAAPAVAQDTFSSGVIITDSDTGNAALYVNDDAVLGDQACIGFSCVRGEVFDTLSTLRLNWSRPGIEFRDSSVSGSFPSDDWRLEINDNFSLPGGQNFFRLRNLTGNTVPFTITGGAPGNALYVDASGDVGLGTSIPQARLHIETTDTSGLRLSRSGAGAWDASVTAVGSLALRNDAAGYASVGITDGAPQNALVIGDDALVLNGLNADYDVVARSAASDAAFVLDGATGNVGIGVEAARAPLHVLRSDNTATVLVEDTGGAGAQEMFRLRNNGGSFFTLDNTDAGTTWFFTHENASPNRFIIADAVADGPEFSLTAGGDLTIPGNFISGNTTLNVPDYVFEDGYALRPLSEVAAFIGTNRHLPEVPSAAEIAAQGLDMTDMQMRLLKKVEELTLYTLEQEEIIDTQKRRLQAQEAETADLRAELAALRGLDARLARLEAAAAE